jgi:hypothetical protein
MVMALILGLDASFCFGYWSPASVFHLFNWLLLILCRPAAAGEVLFADVLLLPNGMSKVGTTVKDAGCFWFISFVGFLWDVVIDGDGYGRPRVTCRDAGMHAPVLIHHLTWAPTDDRL